MKDFYKEYLFSKGFLVSEQDETSPEEVFGTLIGLGELFNIVITKNANLADIKMIHTAEQCLGINVPMPFYKGFPASVRDLTKDQLIIDQLYSYFVTYGLNDFEGEGTRSVFENEITRSILDEKIETKKFEIITKTEAENKLKEYVNDLLLSTRPLSVGQYSLVEQIITDYSFIPKKIASKNTAIKLLNHTRNTIFTKFLTLPDVIKVVEDLLASDYRAEAHYTCKIPPITKLNLKNKDRKFISNIIRILITKATANQMKECIEKRKIWKGLLHHLHFRPDTEAEKIFVDYIFNDEYSSNMAVIEANIQTGNIKHACNLLADIKGPTAVLRNMNYLLSRCKSQEDKKYVINKAFTSDSTVVLIQQLYNYYNYDVDNRANRWFKFTKNNLLKVYYESYAEQSRRKSYITAEDKKTILLTLENKIQQLLKGKIGKVYIDEEMVSRGVPIQETAGNSGYGVLTRGSRIPLDGRTIRLFTYWEKVNDIDLSAIGLTKDGCMVEFSWRTFANNQNNAICFSGDQTRGYEGGSEYIDVNLDKFKDMYPSIRYIICCNNVFSGIPFDKCICTAGYMLREKVDSGEVFEPKTV